MGKYDKYLSESGGGKSKCILCGHGFKQQKDSCTTVLRYHFQTKHPEEFDQLNGKRGSKAVDDEPTAKKPKEQRTIIESFKNNTIDDAKTEKLNRAIMQLISCASLPINFVDHPAWKNFCAIAIPKFNCKSRNHFQRNELNRLHEEYKKKIFEELKNVQFVSIGFDGWTDSSNKHQYLGVIVHFVEKNSLAYRVLGVVDIKSASHTGEFLKEKLVALAEEFDIEDKIVALVRDGGPDVKSAARLFGKPHFDCFAHKLNLAVKDGTDVFISLKTTLNKLRKISHIVSKSANVRREFAEVSASLDVPPLGLKKHIEVRWNTIHAVFERALKVKDTIDFLSTEHIDWPRMTSTDWKTAESVVEILQSIVDATELIQSRGMTSSAIIPLCKVLIGELDEVPKFREFCDAMSKKLNKELAKYEAIDFLKYGMLLDIRFKDMYAEDKWTEALFDDLLISFNEEDKDIVKTSAVPPTKSKENPFSRFMKAKTQKSTPKVAWSSQKELIRAEHTKWFSEETDMDQCPIEYWNKSSSQEKFPNLYKFQTKFLSAPATTAEAERLFSSAKTILTDNRKMLSSENFAMLLFLHQNIRMLGFGEQTLSGEL